MVVCGACGGSNVEVAAWVNPNTGEVVDEFGSWDSLDTNWCHDCDAHVELVDRQAKTGSRAER
jgi:hypothetical protein